MSQNDTFQISLDNFEGPFDLLLQLIGKHKLDITEIALSKVTDEFISYVVAAEADLEQTSSFLVVAATLLDLKAARLLPSGEVEDPDDLAILEARDLLFARLLQYRAFKEMAAWLGQRFAAETDRHPRPGGLGFEFSGLKPPVKLDIEPVELARLAAAAMEPKEALEVSLTHLHAPQVSVANEARVVMRRLQSRGVTTFRALTSDSPNRMTTVARFLALLELYRESVIAFEQLTCLGELTIRWVGKESDVEIKTEFDAMEVSQ